MKRRILVCLAAIALATRFAGTAADAANIAAAPPEATSPLSGGGIGDLAPFSLETSGAGGDYTRSYIPNQTLRPPPSAQPPAQTPVPSPSFPSLPPS